MADDNFDPTKSAVAPQYLLNMKDMGFTCSVMGYEDHLPVMNWGVDSHCFASPHIAGTYVQQSAMSSGPLYIRLPIGLHVAKLCKVMFGKATIASAELIQLGTIGGQTNVVMATVGFEALTVEEIQLGNSTRGRNNKNFQHVDNNKDNTVEIFLRFAKIEVTYLSYDQKMGTKLGQDAASADISTGEVK